MAVFDLKINHLKKDPVLDIQELSYSFKADEKGPFLAVIADENGNCIASREVTLEESGAFAINAVLDHAKKYFFIVKGKTEASFAFETADVLDAPFITCTDVYAPVFSKNIRAASGIREARLTITGLGLYRAEIDGVRVGNDYLTPGFNDYNAYVRYQTYDVTGLIHDGSVLRVHMGNGWFSGRFGLGPKAKVNAGRFGTTYELSAKLVIHYENGNTDVIRTDESWTYTDSSCKANGIYDGEERDYTAVLSVPHSAVLSDKKFHTVPDFGTKIVQKDILKPTLYVSPKGEQILDFHQNMVGFVRFKGFLKKGARLELKHGEVLQQECFYNENYRSAKAVASYISDGTERIYEPMFTFYGFRYVLVTGLEKVNPDDFEGVVLYSDLDTTISCTTDNPKINQLLHNAFWGQRSNFVDVPTDCPQRDERLGWTGDTQVFTNTACYQMDSYNFYRKFMKDLRADQTMYYNGDIPCYSPSLGHDCRNGGSVWADCATIIPWNHYMFYGDKELLKKNYPLMRDYVECLIRKDMEQGGRDIILEGASYGDWLAQDGLNAQSVRGGTDYQYINAMYYYYSTKLTAMAARETGNLEDADRYDRKCSRIKAAILDEFFTRSGRLSVKTQTAYILALTFGVYVDKDRTLEEFKVRLSMDNYKLKTGFTGTPLLLPCLFNNGLASIAYAILYNEGFPGWLYAVNLGATTIWERWNSLLEDGTISGTGMNSFNHYAYGSVCESIYGYIAGLRAAAPGWRNAVIEPHPHYQMKHIDLSYDSPAGKYSVCWKATEEDRFVLEVEIPYGCKAEVILPFTGERKYVGAGKHSFVVENARKLNYPFDADTPLFEIVTNEKANNLLKSKFPGTYRGIMDNGEQINHDSHLLFAKGCATENVNEYLRMLEALKA